MRGRMAGWSWSDDWMVDQRKNIRPPGVVPVWRWSWWAILISVLVSTRLNPKEQGHERACRHSRPRTG